LLLGDFVKYIADFLELPRGLLTLKIIVSRIFTLCWLWCFKLYLVMDL